MIFRISQMIFRISQMIFRISQTIFKNFADRLPGHLRVFIYTDPPPTGEESFFKSVGREYQVVKKGREYQVVKKGREYHGCGEEYTVIKRKGEAMLSFL